MDYILHIVQFMNTNMPFNEIEKKNETDGMIQYSIEIWI